MIVQYIYTIDMAIHITILQKLFSIFCHDIRAVVLSSYQVWVFRLNLPVSVLGLSRSNHPPAAVSIGPSCCRLDWTLRVFIAGRGWILVRVFLLFQIFSLLVWVFNSGEVLCLLKSSLGSTIFPGLGFSCSSPSCGWLSLVLSVPVSLVGLFIWPFV